MGSSGRSTTFEVTRNVLAELATVQTTLRSQPEGLLGAAFPGCRAHDDGSVDAVLHLARPRSLRIPVVVELWTPSASKTGAVLDLRWRARRLPGLFPTMAAGVSLRPRTGGTTEVVLDCTYVAPFGILGYLGDRLLGERAARATAGQFLEDLVRILAPEFHAP